jgi:nucleoid-associated protein YejK
MGEETLLEELSKNLKSPTHKRYVHSYTRKRASGLSESFDELVKADLSET